MKGLAALGHAVLDGTRCSDPIARVCGRWGVSNDGDTGILYKSATNSL
jgi:hypothetical protein